MAGGEDEEGSRTVSKQPIFPPYGNLPRPQHSDLYNTHPSVMDHKVPSPHGTTPGAYSDQAMKSSVGSPVVRSDPPATTADEPVTLPSADDEEGESYGEQMSEVLAKVGQEELAKTGPGSDSLIFAENLSTDPNMPVFMKRKRGRPRKHPQPEQRRREVVPGRRLGRPPKSSSRLLRVMQRKIKKEPVDGPLLVEQLLEEELVDHLPTQQSLATESDRDENAIRFTDVGNHLPLLVAGQHLCAVCLTRHGYRQSTGMRRTRATSFKRFTSVICRTCNKFLCVAPRADGRTCFDIYHTMKDFICSDVPEFNRKESGDSDIISAEFDDSPDLTEDANMLLQLLQVASGEINKLSDLDHRERKDSMDTSLEPIYPRNSVSQDGSPCTDLAAAKLNNATSNSDIDEHGTGLEEDIDSLGGGDGIGNPDRLDPGDDVGNPAKEKKTKPAVNDGQVEPLNLLLKVLKKHRVLSVSETHQLRLERRPRKYNMTNRNAQAYAMFNSRSPDDLTRKYRRKGRPRKHVSTDEEGDHQDEGGDDSLSLDGEGPINLYSDIITPGVRRKYACGRCHAEFNLIARMKVHLKAHVARKSYSCPTCGITFRTKGKLAEHRKQHKTEKTHKCPECDESFKKMILLRRHMRTHQDVKPYECRICGSRFSYASSLKEHALNKHLGERPFKCSECDQGFTRQINLLEHMRMHTGERPFKCPKCEQSFARKSGLKSHMISHTGEKKHVCETCGARFRHKIALTEHQRTHTGEKPFACQHCGQRFAASTTLRNHVRLHTGEKPHACKVCGAGFAQRTSLNCHMKKHGITPPESKSPRNNWTKNFNKAQNHGQMQGQEDQNPGQLGQMATDQSHLQGPLHGPPPQMHHHQGHQLDHAPHTPQPHDYSDKSHLQAHGGSHIGGHGGDHSSGVHSGCHSSGGHSSGGHSTGGHSAGGHSSGGHSSGGHGDAMMAQAVSMAFSKMVPDMLQGGMVMPRRPDSGPSPLPPPVPPGTSQAQSHSMSHHQVAQPQATHHSLTPTHRSVPHDGLQGTTGHVQSQTPNHLRTSLLHNDNVHGELERPASHHSNHGNDVKPMQLTSTALPWSQDPSNLPAFPFDPAFHPQMPQSFPGMLPGQPNHGHSYPEQPRFPFDNRFGMEAWAGHTNWKHKYQ